ncbi:AAA family ATPase [Desulfotruncus alcoholivorax]|uniref:AAA family ATPase n=1 Tax=Desulfotruncus alcoholivorax TaxID=265477 RepID=UPI00040341BF|nr:MoxR family ATPase [Desulfotruncus alcoholivorax]
MSQGQNDLIAIKTELAEIKKDLSQNNYVCDDITATVLYMTEKMNKPLLIEGPAGVGKTELARSFCAMRGRELIRLQCYEGLDETKAIYEWNYKKQLLYIQAAGHNKHWEHLETDIFSEPYLLARPLLRALISPVPSVLLIDEIDKVDQEFEAMLLELLGEWQITIPELGTIRAQQPPTVFLTSNRSRELSEALKRRCLYLYLDYPPPEREKDIIINKVPGIEEELAQRVVAFVEAVRGLDLHKPPGISETVDWAAALRLAGLDSIDTRAVNLAGNTLLKYQTDVEQMIEKYHAGQLMKGASPYGKKGW